MARRTYRPMIWLIKHTDGRRYVRLRFNSKNRWVWSWGSYNDSFGFGHWTKAVRIIKALDIPDTTLEVIVHDRDITLDDGELI